MVEVPTDSRIAVPFVSLSGSLTLCVCVCLWGFFVILYLANTEFKFVCVCVFDALMVKVGDFR